MTTYNQKQFKNLDFKDVKIEKTVGTLLPEAKPLPVTLRKSKALAVWQMHFPHLLILKVKESCSCWDAGAGSGVE